MADSARLQQLTRELVDKGKLIEAGWISFQIACVARGLIDAPADQIRDMRMAFFAGAEHLLSSVMTFVEAGEEPTDNDLKRLDMVDQELQAFLRDFELRHTPTKGTA